MMKVTSVTLAFVMIFTLCMPAFGAYATQESATILEFAPLSNFVGNTAAMESTTDSPSGESLRVTGAETGHLENGTGVWGYSEHQDWSKYEHVNLWVKNNDTSKDTTTYIIITPLLNKTSFTYDDMSSGYWLKKLTISSSSWTLLTIPMAELTNADPAPAGKSEIGGICFAQTYGDFSLGSFWLSKTETSATTPELTSISIADGARYVSTDLGQIVFTYDQELPAGFLEGQVSLTNLKTNQQVTGGFEVAIAGDELQVIFSETFAYDTTYKLQVGEDSVTFTTETDEVVPADDFDTIKARWKKSLVGDDSLSAAVPQEYLDAIKTAADTASRRVSTTAYFSSLDSFRTYFENLEKMAIGYATKGVELDDREAFFEKIEAALAHALEKYYRGSGLGGNGWYNYMVAAPRALINTLIILEDELDPAIVEDALAAIESFVPDVDNPSAASLYAERGSNSLYYTKIRIGTTLLRHDAATLAKFLAYFQNEHNYADTQLLEGSSRPQQGFYPDGTYLYHTRHFLNGTYGSEHFEMLPEIAAFLKGTDYEIDSDETVSIFEIYHNAFEPFIYDGKATPMVTGRAPYGDVYDSTMPRIMKTVVNMFILFEGEEQYSEECAQLKQKIKQYYSANTADLNALPIELFAEASAIVNDSDISDPATYTNTKIYNFGDKAVHHTDSFMTAISMSSSRVYNYESLHDGYTRGWYMGDGMQYVYMNGDTQYDRAWFYSSDPYKRPGTTVDTQTRIAAKIKQGEEYLSSKDFVGGVALGNTGVAAMDLESYHNEDYNPDVKISGSVAGDAPNHDCSLTAKKSWFMFDEEVVSLGTAITANDGLEVLTVLDNRYLPDKDIYVKGTLRDPSTERTYSSVGHLNYGNKIGYVFPVVKESVTVKANGSYVETWLSHGTKPRNVSYEYITLPCKTNEETEAYAAAPDAEVLSNTSSVQAVKDNSTNTTGYVFWQAATFDGISAAKPCTVVKKEADGLVTMAVSDPTHKLDSITLTLNGIVVIPQGTPDNITFEEADGNTVITIDSSANTGEGYEFSYRLQPKVEVESIEISADDAKVSATFTIANPKDRDVNLTVYLALYNSEGKFLKIISKGVTVPAASAGSDSISLPNEGACVAKAFVLKDYVPIGNAAVLQCTQ